MMWDSAGMRRVVSSIGCAILIGLAMTPAVAGPGLTPTTTVVSSSVHPSTYGQSVTFTASVTPNPGGDSVSFFDGGSPLGSATLDSRGKATLSTSMLTVGSHTITASFAGNLVYAGSSSSPLGQTVSKAPTQVTISANPNPVALGAPVTFTAQVPLGATGTIDFKDGSTDLGTATLGPLGTATLTTAALSAGPHSITAAYLGDANHLPSVSLPVTASIRIPTTSTMTATPATVTWGNVVTLGSTVSPPGATGVVEFRRDDGTRLGTCTLSANSCTIGTSALPAGTQPLTAVYAGDPSHALSVDGQTVTVLPAESTTTIAPTTGVWGAPVLVSAQVNPVGATGVVQFTEGVTVLGSAAVDPSGRAVLQVAGMTVGIHTLTARYAGDGNVLSSVGTAQVPISPAPTSLALSATPNPVTAGQPVTVAASVSPATATGVVTFTEGGEVLGACTLAQGTCRITTRTLAVADHVVNAAYSGDPQQAASSAVVKVRVDPLPVRARARAIAQKSKMRVTVAPRCTAQYRFTVEKRTKTKGTTGWVMKPKTYRTKGSPSRRVVDLQKGTYRAAVLGACTRGGATTAPVTLQR